MVNINSIVNSSEISCKGYFEEDFILTNINFIGNTGQGGSWADEMNDSPMGKSLLFIIISPNVYLERIDVSK